MASLVAARPFTPEDAEGLKELDEAYALTHELEPVLSRGSVTFYSRSGHAFVACLEDEPRGFVLAQAVWNGTRPTVYVNRLVSTDHEAALALIEALTKSAYDAAVYDLLVELPEEDAPTQQALEEKGYTLRRTRRYARVLGSRGTT